MIEINNSADYESIKNTLKKSPSIKSKYKIIGEWNCNSVRDIVDFGTYNLPRSTYVRGQGYNSGLPLLEYTTVIDNGDGEIVLDGVEIENTIYNSYYSLADCFLPIRPNAGVVYPMAPSSIRNTSIDQNINSPIAFLPSIDEIDNLPGSPHSKPYLPHKNMKYRYWTSACLGKSRTYVPGMTNTKDQSGNDLYNEAYRDYEFVLKDGGQGRPYPFAVYDEDFWCNLIVVKYQTHLGYPVRFRIDILRGDSWTEIFNSTSVSDRTLIPGKNSDGNFRIYRRSNGTWAPVPTGSSYPEELIDFLTEGGLRTLPDGSTEIANFTDEAVKIRGIRLRVESMSDYNIPFELIELSPRLAVDLTDYTTSFSCSTSIGEGSESLPTSNIVMGTGDIQLSNADGGFFNNNQNSILYKCLGKFVKISPYQVFSVQDKDYQIPIKTLYVDDWQENQDYTVSAALYDFMKVLQSQKASPVMISTLYSSVPVSFAVQTILHGSGFTNFKFLDSKEEASDDLRYFYADDTKTIAEVLDEISKATQSSIYIDPFNNVVCATKDKVLDWNYKNNDLEPEWWLTTEDISIVATTDGEPDPQDPPKTIYTVSEINTTDSPITFTNVNSSSSYLSNIISIGKEETNPINDCEIFYNTKTFRQKKATLQNKDTNKLLREDPLKVSQVASELKISTLWSAAGGGSSQENSNEISLYGGQLLSRISDDDLIGKTADRDGFRSEPNPYKDFNNFLSVKVFDNNNIKTSDKIISLDPFSLQFLRPFNGYLRIDQEIIRYNGIEYTRGNRKRWIFSEEDLLNYISGAGIRDTIRPTGRVGIWMEFDGEDPEFNENTGKALYSVKSSGRGQFNTKIQKHETDKFQSNDKDYINDWEMDVSFMYGSDSLLGDVNSRKPNVHRIEKANSRLLLGSTNSSSIKDYAGLINLSALLISGSGGRELSGSSTKVKAVSTALENDIKSRELNGEKNPEETLRITTTGDLMAQGITRQFGSAFDSFYTSFLFLNKKGRTSSESTTETLSAGMAFNYNKNNGEGYFVEVLGVPKNSESGDFDAKVVVYKVIKDTDDKNKITILDTKTVSSKELFAKEPSVGIVEGFTNIAVRLTGNNKFAVYFNNLKILNVEDKKENKIKRTNDAFLFVRGDTVALFDKFVASAEPVNLGALFLYDKRTTTYKLTDDYYNLKSVVKYPSDAIFVEEFGTNVNQVQKYKFKYKYSPAPIYELVDLTPAGAEYFIEDYDLDSFGGEVVVSNKSGKIVVLEDGRKNQLSVYGVALMSAGEQQFNVDDFLQELTSTSPIRQKIISSRRSNGKISFTIRSEYIQRISMARRLMRWVLKNSLKPKSVANIEILCNPLLELTDVVKVYSPRNNMPESYYSITSINYNIDPDGPKMTVGVREIG